jgi:hypothetical protein
MKIKLNESNGKFQDRDLQYIQLLGRDPLFEKLISKARKDCGVDKKPLENYPNGEVLSKATKHANGIVETYGMPSSWLNSISNFIVMGRFTSPGSGIYKSGLVFDYPSGRAIDLSITVTQKTSFDDFYKWILANKKSIKEHLKKLPRKSPKRESTYLYRLKALEYHNQKKTLKEISELLDKEFQNDPDYVYPDEPRISRWISRFNKTLKHLPEK